MTYFEAIDIVKSWLKAKEAVTNERVLRLVNDDPELQQLVLNTLEKQRSQPITVKRESTGPE